MLSADDFNEMWLEFEREQVAHLLSTEPHEAKKREGVYAQLNGARNFMLHIAGYAKALDALADKHKPTIEHPVVDDEDEDDGEQG